jgi:hypothetical protein
MHNSFNIGLKKVQTNTPQKSTIHFKWGYSGQQVIIVIKPIMKESFSSSSFGKQELNKSMS